MKKYLFLTVLLVTGFSFAQSPQKIGYVDSQIILTQLPEAIKAQGDLDALANRWSAQVDSMTRELETEYKDYQKQAGTMPEDKKATVQQSLVQKEQVIQEFRRQKFAQQTGDLYKKQEEIFNPIKEKIYKAIQEVAQAEGLQFIFDKSGDIILLYADPAFDMTYRVMDKLKRG
ncbi:MAG: OmpH family outer membrane protein [Ignavibacteriaceae bacterium]